MFGTFPETAHDRTFRTSIRSPPMMRTDAMDMFLFVSLRKTSVSGFRLGMPAWLNMTFASSLGPIWAQIGRHRPMLVRSRPMSRPNRPNIGRTRLKFGQIRAEVGQTSAEIIRCWSNPECDLSESVEPHCRAKFGRPNLSEFKVWPSRQIPYELKAKRPPNLALHRPTRGDVNRCRPHLFPTSKPKRWPYGCRLATTNYLRCLRRFGDYSNGHTWTARTPERGSFNNFGRKWVLKSRSSRRSGMSGSGLGDETGSRVPSQSGRARPDPLGPHHTGLPAKPKAKATSIFDVRALSNQLEPPF